MSEIKNKILNGLELTSEDFFSISLGEVEDVEYKIISSKSSTYSRRSK